MFGIYVFFVGYYDVYYKKGLQVRILIKWVFDEVFQKYDVIIIFISLIIVFKIGERVLNLFEMYMLDICIVLVNIVGFFVIFILCGFDSKGFLIGFQIIGKVFDEQMILRVVYIYE